MCKNKSSFFSQDEEKEIIQKQAETLMNHVGYSKFAEEAIGGRLSYFKALEKTVRALNREDKDASPVVELMRMCKLYKI